MKKILLILLFLSNGFASAWCQSLIETMPSKPVHSLSLGVGLSHTGLKNETVSSLIFSTVGLPMHLTYRRESTVSRQYAQLQFLSQTLESPFKFMMEDVGGHLSYGYLRRIKSSTSMNIFLGGECQVQGAGRRMLNNINVPRLITLFNSLHLAGMMDYSIGKHKFEGQLNVALLGYNLRAGNNLSDAFVSDLFDALGTRGKFETLPNYLNLAWRLSYIPFVSTRHIQWRVDYWGNFHRFNKGQYLGVLHNQLTTSLTYKF
jgi:hypothetical protein